MHLFSRASTNRVIMLTIIHFPEYCVCLFARFHWGGFDSVVTVVSGDTIMAFVGTAVRDVG